MNGLRDHSQPCDHGARDGHDYTIAIGSVASDKYCPGGREVTIDYEAAAAEYLFATDPVPPRTWDMLPFDQQQIKLTIAKAIIAAAISETDEEPSK